MTTVHASQLGQDSSDFTIPFNMKDNQDFLNGYLRALTDQEYNIECIDRNNRVIDYVGACSSCGAFIFKDEDHLEAQPAHSPEPSFLCVACIPDMPGGM